MLIKGIIFMVMLAALPVNPVHAGSYRGGDVAKPGISAEKAMEIVERELPRMRAGDGKAEQNRQGDTKVIVPIMKDKMVVAKIKVNPLTGEIIPKGYRIFTPKMDISPLEAESAVESIIPRLTVGNPWQSVNRHWKVPLVLDGTVIAEVRVDGWKGEIVKAADEKRGKSSKSRKKKQPVSRREI